MVLEVGSPVVVLGLVVLGFVVLLGSAPEDEDVDEPDELTDELSGEPDEEPAGDFQDES